jgi:hypothetical protein
MADVTLDDIYLAVTADDADAPQVRTPLSELAAGSLAGDPVSSAVSRVSHEGDQTTIVFSLPMPFARELDLVLENNTGGAVGPLSVAVWYRAVPQVAPLLSSGTIGYLYAHHRRQADFVPGRDVELLDWRGAGRLVGVVLVASSDDPENRRILEGDDRIYIDGAPTPQIHGTGTEDFFNGGWYYSFGPFSLPTHGHPTHLVDEAGDHTSQYRFLLTDSIPFFDRLRMTMEHGPVNDLQGSFSSTVFFYGNQEARASNVTVITAEELASDSGQPSREVEGPLVGTGDPTVRAYRDVTIERPFSFRVDLADSKHSVLLRRLTDYTIANQRADVFVNGEYAGRWLTPGFVPESGIVSSEFLVSGALTSGGDSVEIEIRPLGPWSVVELHVLAVPTRTPLSPVRPHEQSG